MLIQPTPAPKRESTVHIESDNDVLNRHTLPIVSVPIRHNIVTVAHTERKLIPMPKGSGKMPRRKPVK